MISPATDNLSAEPPVADPTFRTVWGLDPTQIHARYWAASGVQVVRVGEPSEVVPHAELYLLTDPRSLPLFRLRDTIETLNWVEPTVLILRLRDPRERGYREHVVSEADGRFLRFRRDYDGAIERRARVALTPDAEIAQLWQQAGDPLAGWRRLRRFVPRDERATMKLEARVYDRLDDGEVARMMSDLVRDWRRPAATIPRARPVVDGDETDARAARPATAWRDPTAQVDAGQFVGPAWVGAGRRVEADGAVVGPAVLWDDPRHRPAGEDVHDIAWLALDPDDADDDQDRPDPYADEAPAPAPRSDAQRAAKRAFDVASSLAALVLILPLFPLIMLVIWIEDRRPFFFGHERQSIGGRPFMCWKFRSMRRDAEEIKRRLIAEGRNQADGAQFFMEDDPRITRVGKVLRKTNLDELPQLWNVLRGEMSMVGPRPSPDKENQFAPAWREARLSVKPGITGLWQIRRTRAGGNDFQEWIKYDIEYVERQSLWLDVVIIYKTLTMIARKLLRS